MSSDAGLLVVQPGLEFDATEIHHLDVASPDGLSPVLADYPNLAFEAHSTDYQRAGVFPELAKRHFAVLKVGPALTFAYRQAIYALDHIGSWYASGRGTVLADTMEALMLAKPGYWSMHYSGSSDEVRRLRHFGYSDRIRYYWKRPEAEAGVLAILDDLAARKLDLPLLQQYFSASTIERAQSLADKGIGLARALIYSQVQEALLPYFSAYSRHPSGPWGSGCATSPRMAIGAP